MTAQQLPVVEITIADVPESIKRQIIREYLRKIGAKKSAKSRVADRQNIAQFNAITGAMASERLAKMAGAYKRGDSLSKAARENGVHYSRAKKYLKLRKLL